MVNHSWIDFKGAEIGDNAYVSIPMVDKCRGDLRNILGDVLDRNEHPSDARLNNRRDRVYWLTQGNYKDTYIGN